MNSSAQPGTEIASVEGKAITSRLTELEMIVAKGLRTFIEVGEALREIRDSHLYGEGTFESYCQTRWGISRSYAHRTIEAADVAGMLPIGNKPPTESHARELAPLKADPDQMSEAWEEASADGKPTAAKVKEAVTRRTGAVVEVPPDDGVDDVGAGVDVDGEIVEEPPLESPSTTVDDEAKALVRAFLATWMPGPFEGDIEPVFEGQLPDSAWSAPGGGIPDALADAYVPYVEAITRINAFIFEEIGFEEKGLTAISEELALITPLLSDNLDGTGACWIVHLEDTADTATRLWRQLDSAISGGQG